MRSASTEEDVCVMWQRAEGQGVYWLFLHKIIRDSLCASCPHTWTASCTSMERGRRVSRCSLIISVLMQSHTVENPSGSSKPRTPESHKQPEDNKESQLIQCLQFLLKLFSSFFYKHGLITVWYRKTSVNVAFFLLGTDINLQITPGEYFCGHLYVFASIMFSV